MRTAAVACILASVLVICVQGCKNLNSEAGSDQSEAAAASEAIKTVMIVLLVRNKAHTLPHFLAMLDGLEYPKERLRLWIRSDHNRDATPQLLKRWLADVREKYGSVNVDIDGGDGGDEDPIVWTPGRQLNAYFGP